MNHTTPTEADPTTFDAATGMAFASLDRVIDDHASDDSSDTDRNTSVVDDQVSGDAIEFRVLRSGAPVRRLRLTGHRYTFGSGEGCSIRLSDPAIHPMHAVLIRDSNRTLVRAYSIPVEINGRSTTESTLNVGDVLTIGHYRFEVLSTTTDVQTIAGGLDQTSPGDTFAEGNDSIARFESPDPQLPPPGDNVWRERLRREVAQWHARQAECDRREARCDDREANLRGRESELWARAEHLYRREAQLQSQEAAAIQIHEEYAQKQAELINLREEQYARQRAYEQREQEFRAVESQFQQQEADYRKQLGETSQQLEQSQRQAESATDSVQRMREQFLHLNEQIEQLSSQQDQLYSEDAGQREQQQQLIRELESARDQALEAKSESDTLREQSESRAAEMQEQLEAMKAEHQSAVEEYEQRLAGIEASRAESEDKARHAAEQLDSVRADQGSQSDQQHERLVESESLREQAEQRVADMTAKLAELESAQNDERRKHQSRLESSESQRQRAEQRIEELAAQLESLESTDQADQETHQAKLAESEEVAQQLREQVESLQRSVQEAQQETEQLRTDYQQACDSVRQLEQLVADSNDKSNVDRDSWEAEVDQLRQSVEQLSVELARANGELTELRQSNAELTNRLEEMRQQNDELRQESEARPSEEALHALRDELDQANDQIESLQQEYDQTLKQLEEVADTELPQAESPESESPESESPESESPESESSESEADRADQANHTVCDDAAVTQLSAEQDPAFPTAETILRDQAPPAGPESTSAPSDTESPWGQENRGNSEPVGWSEPDSPESNADRPLDQPLGWPAEDEPLESDCVETTDDDAHDANVWPQPIDEVSPPEALASDPPASPWGEPDTAESAPPESPWPARVDEETSDGPTTPWKAADEIESGEVSLWDSAVSDDPAAGQQPPYQAEVTPNQPESTPHHEEITPDGESSSLEDHDSRQGSLASSLIDEFEATREMDDPSEEAGVAAADSTGDEAVSAGDDQLPDAAAAGPGSDDGTLMMSREPQEQEGDREPLDEAAVGSWLEEEPCDPTAMISESAAIRSIDEVDPAADRDTDYESDAAFIDEPGHPEQTEQGLQQALGAINPEIPDHVQLDTSEIQAIVGDGEDDSIEAYMNRLLRRVHGDESVDDASKPETVALPPAGDTSVIVDQEGASLTNSNLIDPVVPIDHEAPLVPRSEAPEKHSNLSAMRRLANESARNAINRSARVHIRDMQIKAVTKFAFAAVALACGWLCLVFIPGAARYLAGAMTIVVAGVCMYEGILLFAQGRRSFATAGPHDETDMEADFLESAAGPTTVSAAAPSESDVAAAVSSIQTADGSMVVEPPTERDDENEPGQPDEVGQSNESRPPSADALSAESAAADTDHVDAAPVDAGQKLDDDTARERPDSL